MSERELRLPLPHLELKLMNYLHLTVFRKAVSKLASLVNRTV